MMEEKMKIGPKGQVVIPKVFRKALGIVPGSEVVFGLQKNKLMIKKPEIDSISVFEKIARSGKSIEKIDLDKEYKEMMEERWKKKFT